MSKCTREKRLCVNYAEQNAKSCYVPSPMGDLVCSRELGHSGDHVACNSAEHNMASWPQEGEMTTATEGTSKSEDKGMHDSGKRQDFATGAVRDAADDKPALDLISPFAMARLGMWLHRGAKKYSARNWEKGIPMMRCVASLLRHTFQWMVGHASEDHLAAIHCNSMFLLHYDEAIKRGILPAELDDRPDYKAKK